MRSLYKTLHNISILYSISQAVNFIDDLKRLLQVILSKALETLQAERGSLMLYEYADNSLRVKVVNGLENKQVENDINNGLIECSAINAGEGIAGNVFANKKAIITIYLVLDNQHQKYPLLLFSLQEVLLVYLFLLQKDF